MSDNNLEGKVNDKQSKGFIKKAFRLAYSSVVAAGTTAIGLATAGTAAPLIGAAFAGGGLIAGAINRKHTGKSITDLVCDALMTYSAVSTVVYPMVQLGNVTFPIAGHIGDALIGGSYGNALGRFLYSSTLYNAVFTLLFRGARHVYANGFDPTGMGQAIKKDFWKDSAMIGLLMAPAYALVPNGVHNLNLFGYNLPTFAVNAVPAAFAHTLYNTSPSVKISKADEKKHAPGAVQMPQAATNPAQHFALPNYARNYAQPSYANA